MQLSPSLFLTLSVSHRSCENRSANPQSARQKPKKYQSKYGASKNASSKWARLGLQPALDHSRSKPGNTSRSGNRSTPNTTRSDLRGALGASKSRASFKSDAVAAEVRLSERLKRLEVQVCDHLYSNVARAARCILSNTTLMSLADLFAFSVQYSGANDAQKQSRLEADRYFIIQEVFADVAEKDKVCREKIVVIIMYLTL